MNESAVWCRLRPPAATHERCWFLFLSVFKLVPLMDCVSSLSFVWKFRPFRRHLWMVVWTNERVRGSEKYSQLITAYTTRTAALSTWMIRCNVDRWQPLLLAHHVPISYTCGHEPLQAIRRPYRPKCDENTHPRGANGQTGSRNRAMATTRFLDSATPTSYSTPNTLWGGCAPHIRSAVS